MTGSRKRQGHRSTQFPDPLFVHAPTDPQALEELDRTVAGLLRHDRNQIRTIVCDVSELRFPDGSTVDALARLQLMAKRSGSVMLLRHAGQRLAELIELSGLSRYLPPFDELEPVREPEEREQALGVEEENDPPDPVVR